MPRMRVDCSFTPFLLNHSLGLGVNNNSDMKFNIYVALMTFLFMICSCSKDENKTNCEFIGKWCTENPATGDCFGVELEFRENGDFIQLGTTFFTWESDDCITIDIIHKSTGDKSAEYVVHSVSETTLRIDIGTGVTELTRQ